MTTKEAEIKYEENHMAEWGHRGFAIYNPENKSLKELPMIFGFNNGGSHNCYHAKLLAEDGTYLGEHFCSSEGYMPHDLGVLNDARLDRHETFRAHYPHGYCMDFISYEAVQQNEKLMRAIKINEEK